MDSSRFRQRNLQRSREPLDRRLDNWIETGRQFVDGVSGTRPGKRRSINNSRLSSPNLDKMGQWVGEKLDWFLEDEDEWLEKEPLQSENMEEINFSKKKQPLEAISLRGKDDFSPDTEFSNHNTYDQDWPEESSFRINRWQRSSSNSELNSKENPKPSNQSSLYKKRSLPRSSRRRD